MKTIGIDARLYSKTGVGTYLQNLLRELAAQDTEDLHFILYVLSEDRETMRLPEEKFGLRTADCKWHTFAEQTRFLSIINKDNPDLMHFTYFGYPVGYKGPFVATVHDLTPLLFRTGKASTRNPLYYAFKHFIFSRVLETQIRNARLIITPTHTVKEQIVDRYGYGDKIRPVYEGVGYALRESAENPALQGRYPDPFYIYVGNFYPHKNIERLVKAFAGSPGGRLVLVGPEDHFSASIKGLVEKLGAGERIVFHHHASTSDLVFFYKNAQALIHPSLSEGFGLPLVEAMYFGCPVIASDIPVMRELMGDGYISFNPNDVSDMERKIAWFVRNRPRFDSSSRIGTYSFSRMAAQTLQLYRQVLAQS
jgi:glycosyltransferase involved in cell wall biosynthesis